MELPEWSSGVGKHIVKLGDGDTITGVFRGNVVRFYQHWKNNRPTLCEDRATCPFCNSENEADRKGTGRFRINLMVEEQGKWVAKVFEGGKRAYDRLTSINKDVPIESVKMKISRTGKGTATQIFIDPIHGENGILKDAQKKAIQVVPLIDLSGAEKEEEADGDVPF